MSIDKVTNGNTKTWFSDQYEKLIGKPLPRKELTTEEVLKRLQESTKYRWIPEAKGYRSSSPEIGPVHYIEWKGPLIEKCTCPDSDCRCKGDVMLPPKKIPRGERYFKNALCRKLFRRFKKTGLAPRENFMQRLADKLGVEEAVYKDLEGRGVLSIRGAEFCFSRCIRFYGPGTLSDLKNHIEKQKVDSKVKTVSETNVKIEDIARTTTGFANTVSKQTNVVLNDGTDRVNISEEVLEAPDEVIMKDIDGRELHISTVTDCSDHKSPTSGSYDKFMNIPRFTLSKLKDQIISLKRNICSSVLEMQDINRRT